MVPGKMVQVVQRVLALLLRREVQRKGSWLVWIVRNGHPRRGEVVTAEDITGEMMVTTETGIGIGGMVGVEVVVVVVPRMIIIGTETETGKETEKGIDGNIIGRGHGRGVGTRIGIEMGIGGDTLSRYAIVGIHII